jgi:hypothetical protein
MKQTDKSGRTITMETHTAVNSGMVQDTDRALIRGRRAAVRSWEVADSQDEYSGFRVARTLSH